MDQKIRINDWTKDAKQILAEIIEQNPEKMIGFEYLELRYSAGGAHESDGQTHGRIDKIDARRGFVYVTPLYPYYQVGRTYESSIGETSEGILFPITPCFANFGIESRFLNRRRNEIVKEIERRTGRNLKKEVIEKRRRNS